MVVILPTDFAKAIQGTYVAIQAPGTVALIEESSKTCEASADV